MGREIKRVPLGFDFPLGSSYADTAYDEHLKSCPYSSRPYHDETCIYWSKTMPVGEGWQLWQTVSDGPISPVFAKPEELIEFMSQPVPLNARPHYDPAPFPRCPWAQGWARTVAERFVRSGGSIPSMIVQDGRPLDTAGMVVLCTATHQIEAGNHHEPKEKTP